MNRYEETRAALIDLLRAFSEAPTSLYEVGVPLVSQGYTHDEILNELFALNREKVIKLLPTNELRVLKALD